jgi:phosphate:Na+ symporter
VWLPLSNVIVRLAQKSIPLSEKEKQDQANMLTMLDENLLATPGLAIEQADRAVTLLSQTVGDAFRATVALRNDPEQLGQAQLLIERSHRYQEQIDNYLVQISSHDIGEKERAKVTLLAAGSTEFGRMGRVAERILGMQRDFAGSEEQLTEEDRREIILISGAISEVMQLTFNGFTARIPNVSRTIRYYTEEVMALGDIVKKRFIQRVHSDGRQRTAGSQFTNICYAEEQLIDCCDMISEALIRYDRETGDHQQINSVSDEELRNQVHEFFRDKFEQLER